MKKHYDKTGIALATFLWGIVVLLVIVFLVQILESEELVHGRQASGWYVQAINSISMREFS